VSRFIDEHRGRFGVEPICRTLGVSASAYYQRASGERSARSIEDERLLERIDELHAANYHAYGYRRSWKALRREGVQVGRDRVKRLLRARGIQGAKRRGKPWKTTKADPRAQRRPDLVQRDFSADAPNRLWVADLSYLRCWEGLVLFAFVLDAYSRRVVGWQLAAHMRTTGTLTGGGAGVGARSLMFGLHLNPGNVTYKPGIGCAPRGATIASLRGAPRTAGLYRIRVRKVRIHPGDVVRVRRGCAGAERLAHSGSVVAFFTRPAVAADSQGDRASSSPQGECLAHSRQGAGGRGRRRARRAPGDRSLRTR
jgi:hypothetical protein